LVHRWDTGDSGVPGVPDAGESRIPCVPDAGESRIPGVPDTGEWFFEFSQFFSNFNPLQQPLKQQSIKKQCESLSYCRNTINSSF